MFYSVRKKLPAVDYVSIVRSLYADPWSMLYGAIAATIATVAAGVKTGSPALFAVAAGFIIVGLLRHFDCLKFARTELAADDADEAARWELHATVGGVAIAMMHGIWCLVSFGMVDDTFAQISSITVTVAALVGVAARNFGVDRLVTLQSVLMTVPVALGLFFVGDFYHTLLAVCLIPFFASIRLISANVRTILLNAVHGRVEASRLAGELDTALTTMPHGLCMIDRHGRIAVVNEQVYAILLGGHADEYVGRDFETLIADAREKALLSETEAEYLVSEVRQGGNGKITVGLPDGRQCELKINTKAGHSVLMLEDITERVRDAERINFMARYDGLTQLINRSFFSEQVESQLKHRRMMENHDPVQMMIVDIDDFKHINDTLGHPMGDALLVAAARRISAIFPNDVLICRFGGDEFTIFRSGKVDEMQAEDDANAVLAALRVPFDLRGEVFSINASVGVALSDGAECTLEALLVRADLALYRAKADGKGQYCLFHEEMDIEYKHRQRLKTDLARALVNDELYLLYQPIVDVHTRRVKGCEALVRWAHPELGVVPPIDFIPVAEEIGMMSRISRWVLEKSTSECATWPEDITISVNLSATDFRSDDVVDMVEVALTHSGLDPARLTVEITETTLIEELHAAIKALRTIRRKGIGIALDDFGTGYSSLSYLHTLPFTKLKIDRSFVIDVVENERSRHLLANISKLSRDLNLIVTVEGIETEEQLDVISASAEVDDVQGYLFGAPLPAKDVRELIGLVLPNAKSGENTQDTADSKKSATL